MVSTEGPFSQQAESYYAGNMQSGMSDFYDGMVIPEEAGSVVGYVVIKYEDAAGTEHEERKELTLEVIDMNAGRESMGEMWPEGGGMMVGPEGRPMDPYQTGESEGGIRRYITLLLRPVGIITAACVLMAAGAITVYLIRRRKKRKLEKELEKDEEI